MWPRRESRRGHQTVKNVAFFCDVSINNVGATIGRPPNTGSLLGILLSFA